MYPGTMQTVTLPTTLPPLPSFAEGMVSLDRGNIYREGFTTVEDVVATVRRWGIIVFPGFVGGADLAALNRELNLMIAARKQVQAQIDEYDNMINLRLNRDAHGQIFTAT